MSFPSTVFEDPPHAWGVGRVTSDGVVTPWPVSKADIDDEAESMAERLEALGLGEGGLVLIVSLLSQTIHVAPFELAAGKVGARYSSADATPFDAFRTASLIRQLRPTVVLGVDGLVLDGLEEQGRDLAEVFGPVPVVVAAGAGARARLVAAGVDAGQWLTLGPTSAVRAPGGDTFVYDAGRWRLDRSRTDGDIGELLITNLVPRLTPSDRLPTGVHGQVVDPGRFTV